MVREDLPTATNYPAGREVQTMTGGKAALKGRRTGLIDIVYGQVGVMVWFIE